MRVLYLTDAVQTHVVPRGALRRLIPRTPAELTATWWPGSDHPLLVVEVDDAALAQLRPWFARKLDDHVEIPRHPDAGIRRGKRGACLYIGYTRIGGTVAAQPSWLAEPSCTVGLLPADLTSGDCLSVAAQFAVLLDLGHALAAEVPLTGV
jgi:hypothetical protein